MRVVISGMAGFVGAHAARAALVRGWKPVGLDNLYTGSRDNLAWIGAGAEMIEHDVREPWPACTCDAILHLACPASPPHYQRDPIYTWETAVLGTRNALIAAETANVPVVIASTSEVYGDAREHPQRETYWGHVNPVGPRACYDEGKRAAETLANEYRRMRGVDARIVRIFNTYGPRMAFDDGRVISNFLVQALRGEPLTVYGDGGQSRSFCFVDDLVDALLALITYPQPVPFPVNLGNPVECSILALTETIEQVLETPIERVHKPLPEDDPGRRRPEISRAKTLLDWHPQVTLTEGLARTAKAFRQRLQAAQHR